MTVPDLLVGIVGTAGGLSAALGGWSSLSLGSRSLYTATQILSALGLYVCKLLYACISSLNSL